MHTEQGAQLAGAPRQVRRTLDEPEKLHGAGARSAPVAVDR